MSIPDDSFIIPSDILGDPILTFSSEHFESFINTSFQIQNPQIRRITELRLIQVKKWQSKFNSAKGLRGESYSLLFEAERAAPIK